MSRAADPLDRVHPVLRAALEALPPERRPAPPYGLGEKPPLLSGASLIRLGLAMADWMTSHLPMHPEARAEVEERRKTMFAGMKDEEARAGRRAKKEDLDAASAGARLLAAGLPPELAGDFICWLDAEILRLEFLERVALCKEWTGRPIDRVLFRANSVTGGSGAWIARLQDGPLALLVRGKREWVCFTGTREEILANTPDPYLPGAANALRSPEEGRPG